MATITSIVSSARAVQRIRAGSAQANSGQTDWVAVPTWAKTAQVHWEFTGMAGTTPVLTPEILQMDPVTRNDDHATKVAEHTAFTGFTAAGVNEVQTLTLTAGIATETFTLTNGAVASSVVTIPVGGYASVTTTQIYDAIVSIPALGIQSGTGVAVTGGSGTYTITFSGPLARTNIGDTTVTDKVGAADGSVANTTVGVAGAGLIVNIGPGVTGIADDVTNSATARSVVSLNAALPPILGLKTALDRTTGNETYTYTLTVCFRG